jgi:hypothetical protein
MIAFLGGALAGILATTAGVLAVAAFDRNWTAATALAAIFTGFATLAAVGVALLPTWRDEQRRQEQARLLRASLLSHLDIIRQVLEVVRGEGGFFGYFDKLVEDIQALRALYPQVHLLDPPSFDGVVQLMKNLDRLRRFGPTVEQDSAIIAELLALTQTAIERLEAGGTILHGAPSQPWKEKKDEPPEGR